MNNVTRSMGIHAFHVTGIMPLNKYAGHIVHVYPTAHLLSSTYIPHITAHLHIKSINCNLYLPYHCKICVRHKYNPQMPNRPKITWHKLMRKVCQYIYHIQNHWHQPCTRGALHIQQQCQQCRCQ